MIFLAQGNEILYDFYSARKYFCVHVYIVSFSSPYHFKWDLFFTKTSYVLIMIEYVFFVMDLVLIL